MDVPWTKWVTTSAAWDVGCHQIGVVCKAVVHREAGLRVVTESDDVAPEERDGITFGLYEVPTGLSEHGQGVGG